MVSEGVVGEDTLFDVIPGNSLYNGSMEETYQVDGNDWQYLPHWWNGYPHMNNMTVVFTGETMYNSDETFEALDGDAAVKLWGLYDGENTENNLFQEWYDSSLPPGTEFFVEAALMSDDADWIGQGGNSVVLFAKYFTDGWGWIGMDTSEPFSGENTNADEWYYWGVHCMVPEGATIVQVGAMPVSYTPLPLPTICSV